MLGPMRLSALIVTHRGGPLLEACVRALARQTRPPDAVRVVVSNADPVPLPRQPDGVPWALEIVYHGCNAGFAAAANTGLRGLEGAIALLNDDTEADPGFLEALERATLAAGPGIYQPTILLMDGGGRMDNLGHRLFPDGFNLADGRGRAPQTAPPPTAGAFSGAAVLLTPEVLEAVGLFDESFEAFGEDVDLSLRAVRAGFQVRTTPEARIHHKLGASYGRVNPRKVFLVERNRVRLMLRNMPVTCVFVAPLATPARLAALLVARLNGVGVAAEADPRSALAALAGALAGLTWARDALEKRGADAAGWRLGELDMLRHLWRHRARLSDLGGTA